MYNNKTVNKVFFVAIMIQVSALVETAQSLGVSKRQRFSPEIKRLLAKSNFVTVPQYLQLVHQLNGMLMRVAKLRKTKNDKRFRSKVQHLLSNVKDKQKKYTLTIKHYNLLQDKVNQLSNQIEDAIMTQKMQEGSRYDKIKTRLGF